MIDYCKRSLDSLMERLDGRRKLRLDRLRWQAERIREAYRDYYTSGEEEDLDALRAEIDRMCVLCGVT